MDGISDVLDFQSAPVVAMTSYLLTHALEWAKKSSKISWLSQQTTKKNNTIVLLYSLFAAVGIGWVWSGYSAVDGGSFTIHLPPVQTAVNGFWAWWTVRMNQARVQAEAAAPKPLIVGEVMVVNPLAERR